MGVVESVFDPRVVEEPCDYYAWLCDNGRVHRIADTNTLLVTRSGLIQEVVTDPTTFSSASNEFLSIDGDGNVAEPVPMVALARLLGLSDEVAPFLKQFAYEMTEQIDGFASENRLSELREPLYRRPPRSSPISCGV
jgi:hypothetical protein